MAVLGLAAINSLLAIAHRLSLLLRYLVCRLFSGHVASHPPEPLFSLLWSPPPESSVLVDSL